MTFDEFAQSVSAVPCPVILVFYLLRDTLKVMGSGSIGLTPATWGIFYADESRPHSVETGHTTRVCGQNRVQVLNQAVWREWMAN